MKKLFFLLMIITAVRAASAQPRGPVDISWKKEYRETVTRINDLVHTKLDVKFDFKRTTIYK
jgi:aminopeptidase N